METFAVKWPHARGRHQENALSFFWALMLVRGAAVGEEMNAVPF